MLRRKQSKLLIQLFCSRRRVLKRLSKLLCCCWHLLPCSLGEICNDEGQRLQHGWTDVADSREGINNLHRCITAHTRQFVDLRYERVNALNVHHAASRRESDGCIHQVAKPAVGRNRNSDEASYRSSTDSERVHQASDVAAQGSRSWPYTSEHVLQLAALLKENSQRRLPALERDENVGELGRNAAQCGSSLLCSDAAFLQSLFLLL
ncbi:hypothetical protein BI380_14030 [Delftia tsuruhatensis]|uniref:Uncharacterized protein n=1 Tax=Delftia tsuruhatensis TaxID=180282 RepID=A0ABN4SGF4_9BURK|nr:hypothetical protein BI380_14030 [Delftia tsuruhatensis]